MLVVGPIGELRRTPPTVDAVRGRAGTVEKPSPVLRKAVDPVAPGPQMGHGQLEQEREMALLRVLEKSRSLQSLSVD